MSNPYRENALPSNGPKPGYKTTEFWLSFLVITLGALLAADILPAAHIAVKIGAAIMAVLQAMGYTWSRTRAKQNGNGTIRGAEIKPLPIIPDGQDTALDHLEKSLNRGAELEKENADLKERMGIDRGNEEGTGGDA